MNIISPAWSYATSVVFGTCLFFANVAVGWADGPDPTTPSPKITERLTLNANSGEDESPESLRAEHLQLKAIVLRDRDNGTALIAVDDTKVYTVRLRRSALKSATNRINLRGTIVAVKDFSDTTVIIQRLDNDQQIVVN